MRVRVATPGAGQALTQSNGGVGRRWLVEGWVTSRIDGTRPAQPDAGCTCAGPGSATSLLLLRAGWLEHAFRPTNVGTPSHATYRMSFEVHRIRASEAKKNRNLSLEYKMLDMISLFWESSSF